MSNDKEPTYMGLRGKPLGLAITVFLTFGFILVGYDQGMFLSRVQNVSNQAEPGK
jgi:hypothetical protein